MKHELEELDLINPFKTCKLDRKRYAVILTELLNNNSKGFVMSLNNKWGTGKTTFVQMWKQDLENNGFKTIYFNAWENDFEDNPLTAIIGELKSVLKSESSQSFNKLIETGLQLSKHIFPTLIKAILNKYIDSDNLKINLEQIVEDSKDLYKREVDEYINRKESIKEFRNYLSKYVADNTSNGKPLVFIIDELDRCRPNYAVSILEQVKHFFNVPNVIFVLSIDKEQLGNAVKGVYGTDLIDSEEYLRRFIDFEYSLPNPSHRVFCEYLIEKYNFKEFFDDRHKGMIGNDLPSFITFTSFIFEHGNLSLRQQEKFIAHCYAVLKTARPKRQILSTLFLTLIYVKTYQIQLYEGIRNKTYSIEQLQFEIKEVFPVDKSKIHFLNNIEANLIFFYNNYISPNNELTTFENGKHILNISAIYDVEKLTNSMISLEINYYDYQISSIEKLMDRIELFSQE